MQPLPHQYRVAVHAGATGYAVLSSSEVADLPSAPPAEFGGPGDAWSPERLLLGAVATCFCFTLRAVAAASKVAFEVVDVEVQGTVVRANGTARFSEIVVRPVMTLPADADGARALRVIARAERGCLVAASLGVPLRVKPEVRHAACAGH